MADDGKATRALQSSLADAKVEVEFWKRKVGGLNGQHYNLFFLTF